MPSRKITMVAGLITGTLALAGCSSSPSSPGSATNQNTTVPSTSSATATTVPKVVTNLLVTSALRTQLIALAGASDNLPVDDVVMEPGLTYYAYDPTTSTYWAGAAFEPTSNAPNQAAFQDAGAYFLFRRTATTSWKALTAGLAGSPCPDIPAAVVAIWNWTAGTCSPPASAYPTPPTIPTTTSTTSPSTPAGFTMAKQAWENGAMAISADQDMYWNEAAADLASVGAGNEAYNEAIAELKQLVSIPETSDTPTQISEAQNDTAALNTFFGTPGLYG